MGCHAVQAEIRPRVSLIPSAIFIFDRRDDDVTTAYRTLKNALLLTRDFAPPSPPFFSNAIYNPPCPTKRTCLVPAKTRKSASRIPKNHIYRHQMKTQAIGSNHQVFTMMFSPSTSRTPTCASTPDTQAICAGTGLKKPSQQSTPTKIYTSPHFSLNYGVTCIA